MRLIARFLSLPATALACVAALPWAATAQTAAAKYAGRPVEDIRLLIEREPASEPALLDLVEPRIGEPLSMERIRESIAHLYSLGRFEDVQVEAADAPGGGVTVTFNLIPLHSIERIQFRGTLGLSEGTLRSAVVERYGASPSIGRIDAAARTLQQLYADEGYLRARVDAVPEILHDPDRGQLTFTVDSGPRATISAADVSGDAQATPAELLRRIGATVGAPFRRVQLQERLDDYVKHLKQRRYYEAAGSLRAVDSEDGRTVALTVVVNAGPPITVRFEGDVLPRDRLNELAPIEREGSVDEDLLEDSEARIENYLRQQGYWKADAAVRRESTPAGLTIVFTIKRGAQYRVAGPIEITGARALSAAEIAALVPLKTGELFVESQLDAGVAAIRTHYRTRGFASVEIKSAVNETDSPAPGEGLVRAVVAVSEGPRSLVGAVTIAGNTSIATGELGPLVKITTGDPYFEPKIIEARDALTLEYLNRGFASAVITPVPTANADKSRVDLAFTVQEGRQTIVDHILIVGNTHTDRDVILRELQFRPGQPLGLQDQFESRRRLSALGLFRRVRITELPHGSGTEHDVLVTVEEAPATSIGYGGGLEATQRLRSTGPEGQAEQHLEFAPRGFFDIGRRNLFGANRSVSLYTRVSLRPRDAPDDPTVDGTGIGFSEYRVVGTYRQPRWFGPNDMTVTAVVEQGVRSTFSFARRGFNMDVVRRLTPALRASGRYSLSSTRTFDERLSEEDQATIDRLFPRVRLSGFSGALARDTRDDVLEPSRGMFVSGEGTVAARALGSQVGFMKTYLQAFAFRPLGSPKLVLATRAAVGLADGFEREVPLPDADGNPLPESVSIEDLPASERFFAGGDTTIRGYALDSVGAPETISANGYPTGGNAVLLLNGELRFPVWREVGAVVFVDGGNVFRRVTEFDFGELRGSVGFGLRYRSPVGPIRVDLGFKMDRRGGEKPTAIHFSLGQAF
ncbi:MAG TPA: POTRA domain-containing protein [Vicinamibacterales bacterium]|nr:POTRA domain-containing protein [Vicinamibacterales bacterium]